MSAPSDKLQVMGSCMYTCERVRHSEAQLKLLVMCTLAFYEPSQTMVYTMHKITKHLHLNHMIPERTEEVQTNIQRHQARETKARTNCTSKKHENVSRQTCRFLELKIQQLLTKKTKLNTVSVMRGNTHYSTQKLRGKLSKTKISQRLGCERESDCMLLTIQGKMSVSCVVLGLRRA